ncbi:DUF2207 domain-containing protein [Aestuariimicrobium sp. T2.26MG-19.2B]|uniref:DUF2207 domain-containing protein n=1 Tax=Aestuariimicrobium sp. T2.26MG-19.2B TaxID=3040679 RepID=UPI0024776B4A|nr:DUF2207 domain-containing protein [Aestuariimicrobium sp. T2.26MG-19.2B]CAI9404158.1 hypothetical protein AESSP_01151 [Aestuariimicrobium sp. T2.26MG-19.2B]
MDNIDLGFLVISVLVSAVLFGVGAIANRFYRDRIYSGLVPGMVPLPGTPAPDEKVKGRSREYSGEVAVAFSPPRGLRPGLVGTIVDGKAEMRDLSATIVDLAVRGHVHIEAVDTDQTRVDDPTKKARDWRISRVAPGPADPLSPFENDVMTSLFQGDWQPARVAHRTQLLGQHLVGHADEQPDSILMSQWVRTRGDSIRALRESLYAQTVANGWYAKPPTQAGVGCLGLLGLVVAFGFVGLMLLTQVSIVTLVSGALIIGSALWLRSRLRPRVPRTALGTAAQIQALGFKKYLETAEASQFKVEEAAGIFGRYLPYAIVFGVSGHWAKVFGEIREAALASDGYDILEGLIWFDLLGGDNLLFGTMAMLGDGGFADLFDGGGLDALGSIADIGDLAGGLGDFASGVGDFVSNIDFGDFDF